MEYDDEVVFFSDDIDEVKAYAAPYGQSYFDEMVSLVEDGAHDRRCARVVGRRLKRSAV